MVKRCMWTRRRLLEAECDCEIVLHGNKVVGLRCAQARIAVLAGPLDQYPVLRLLQLTGNRRKGIVGVIDENAPIGPKLKHECMMRFTLLAVGKVANARSAKGDGMV